MLGTRCGYPLGLYTIFCLTETRSPCPKKGFCMLQGTLFAECVLSAKVSTFLGAAGKEAVQDWRGIGRSIRRAPRCRRRHSRRQYFHCAVPPPALSCAGAWLFLRKGRAREAVPGRRGMRSFVSSERTRQLSCHDGQIFVQTFQLHALALSVSETIHLTSLCQFFSC